MPFDVALRDANATELPGRMRYGRSATRQLRALICIGGAAAVERWWRCSLTMQRQRE